MTLGPTLLRILPCIKKKILDIVPMGLSAPWTDSLDIIYLRPVKKCLGINPMVRSTPLDNSIDIISLKIAEKFLLPLGPSLFILLPCRQ